jgi:hypothetical protein
MKTPTLSPRTICSSLTRLQRWHSSLALVPFMFACSRTVAPAPQAAIEIGGAPEAKQAEQPVSTPSIAELGKQGDDAYKRRDYGRCAELMSAAADRASEPELSMYRYNQACCLALAGRSSDAFNTLSKIENFDGHTEQDDDLKSLHAEPQWPALMARIQKREADLAKLPNGFMVMNQARPSGNFLAAFSELAQLESQFANTQKWPLFMQSRAILASFVGEHQRAVTYYSGVSAPDIASMPSQGVECVDAANGVIDLTKSRQVVMLNEAHHVASHRAFVMRLLPKLRAQGYEYFAAEMLEEPGAVTMKRGWPTQESGLFVNEPTAGNMLRSAIDLGFKIIAYDVIPKCDAGVGMDCQNQRERGQADRLYDQIFKLHPKAKVVIYGGYGHIYEASNRQIDEKRWNPMALYLRHSTGIDPLTIDQTYFKERPTSTNQICPAGEVSLLQSNSGEPWVPDSLHGDIDAVLFHAPTNQQGRPSWRRPQGWVSWPIPPSLCKTGQCQIDIRRANQGADSVPLDRLLINAGDAGEAIVPPGVRLLVSSRSDAASNPMTLKVAPLPIVH